MYSINKLPEANEDLMSIWNYTNNTFGEQQADKYYFDISNKLNTLKTSPKIGVDCSYIKHGYRKYIVNKHVAFYYIDETTKTIHIVRVLSTKMDYTLHL